jgi:TRAP transporter 4TM/12TM fusion protein
MVLRSVEKLSTDIGSWLAFFFALFAIYTAGIALFDEGALRGGVMGLSGVIVLLSKPLAVQHKGVSDRVKVLFWVIDLIILIGFVYTIFSFFEIYETLWDGVYILGTPELIVGFFGILTVIELVRRIFGPILSVICCLVIIYALFGARLPGIFAHAGFTFEETMRAVWYGFDGVFGRPTGIVSTIVLVFIVFGSILEGTGAGAILLKISTALTARIRGGPAHSAIVASALFGTISGSPVANVVGTGVFTIPMIKKQGFPSAFAGAVEAAASSAGQFTPPIMGAVAFLMAEIVGLPYLTVATAAALPALFFYCSLFATVYAEAIRRDISPLQESERPDITRHDWLQSLRFVVPVIIVVLVLLLGRSPAMAGFWALISALVIGFILEPELRRHPYHILQYFQKGGRACAQIIIAVGSIGIVIGVVNLTGVGLSFANLVVSVSEGSFFIGLLMTMLACLVLGMGLPTIPAYLIIVLIMGPAITKLGVPILLVHLFVLYYGVLSNITPPVCIAAYAAAPIAGANPMTTGFQAVRLAVVGFLIPFVLIYNPSLSLVVEFEWLPFIWVIIRLPVAIWSIASSLVGFDAGRLPIVERILRFVIGIAVLVPDITVEIVAFVVGIGIFVFHRFRHRDVELKADLAAEGASPGKGE